MDSKNTCQKVDKYMSKWKDFQFAQKYFAAMEECKKITISEAFLKPMQQEFMLEYYPQIVLAERFDLCKDDAADSSWYSEALGDLGKYNMDDSYSRCVWKEKIYRVEDLKINGTAIEKAQYANNYPIIEVHSFLNRVTDSKLFDIDAKRDIYNKKYDDKERILKRMVCSTVRDHSDVHDSFREVADCIDKLLESFNESVLDEKLVLIDIIEKPEYDYSDRSNYVAWIFHYLHKADGPNLEKFNALFDNYYSKFVPNWEYKKNKIAEKFSLYFNYSVELLLQQYV